jgi:hypothetical protein
MAVDYMFDATAGAGSGYSRSFSKIRSAKVTRQLLPKLALFGRKLKKRAQALAIN